ncbi:MAG: hypothetical protein D3923_11800, partial [Candidatus Electrothrix sp. AR3]|nr:hypothetical protein [Candidatus Electrothrix sp. AR3]
MDNRFENKGKDQNVAQGDGAIGKQTNIFPQPLMPHTLVLVIVLLAGIGVGSYYLFAPAGKSASTQGGNSPAAVAGRDVAVNYNSSGVPPEMLAKYAEELGQTKQIINGFFTALLEQEVPREQWDSKLREIAARHKELVVRLENALSADPEVMRLKREARQAVEAGDYAKAEELLKQAEFRDLQAIEELEQTTRQRRISASTSCADNAHLQASQLRFAKAAEYWQRATDLLPQEKKKERAEYLLKAGCTLYFSGQYSEALPLYKQS